MSADQHDGIEVRFNSEAVEIDPEGQRVSVADNAADAKDVIDYGFMRVVPPGSAPDRIKAFLVAAAGNPDGGYVEVDRHTLQHVRYPNIDALGDAGSSPSFKAGADEQTGSGRLRVPRGHATRGPGRRQLRRLRLVPAHHGAQQDAPRRVRLRHGARSQHSLHRQDEGTARHVATQALRPACDVLESHAQGTCLTTRERHHRGTP